jgi:hypothetical protein
MIIRRFINAVRRQDWVTVCVEFLIVVAGIFVALQVDEWSQSRDERAAEFAYLQRIAADLGTSLAETRDNIDFQTRHANYGALVLEALESCELAQGDRDKFASGIYLAGKYNPAYFVKASIQELLSAGRMTIIRNAALRQQIVEMLQEHEDHLFYMSDVQLRTTPHVNYIDSVAPIKVRSPVGGGSDITWDALDVEFDALCEDQRLKTAINATLNYIWDSNQSMILWTDKLSTVRANIDAELMRLRSQR